MTHDSLLIDAGNHRLKWQMDGRGGPVTWQSGEALPNNLFPHSPGESHPALVASVRSDAENALLRKLLESLGYRVSFAQVVSEQQGLTCGYRDIQMLGVDRWLAMLACWVERKSGFALVSAGTALTLDLVNDQGRHLGGYIIAGIGLQRDALLARSDKLRRQTEVAPGVLEPGLDTSAAVNNGILLAAVAFIQTALRRAGMIDSQLILTGGDSGLLAPCLAGALIHESAVLEGLSLCQRSEED